jgi:hypothetical protein
MSLKEVEKALGKTLPHQKVTAKRGDFVEVGKVGYKKAYGIHRSSWSNNIDRNREYVIKALVTSDGLRSSAKLSQDDKYYSKFRVRQVLVLAIVDMSGNSVNSAYVSYNGYISKYEVGKLFNPNGFTSAVLEDCGQGVHLFPTIKKAYDL